MIPAPVVTVAEPIVCALPPLPFPAQLVGMATPDGIVMTKSDMAELARYTAGLQAWIQAASICIGGGEK